MTASHHVQDLNSEQREAVIYGDGPLMVLAGAGSGKTRVLVSRIATLVDRGVEPRRILAVTFTNKAAGEMRERVTALLGEATKAMWIGTFHATCARLLRMYADKVGLGRDFTIFDDDDQRRLIKAILGDLQVSEKITPRAVLSRIDRVRNAGGNPTELATRDYVDDVARRVYPIYAERLRRENACDFNDLLLKVNELCVEAEVGPKLERRFSHVLVDEFQDTNKVQYELARHLARGTGNLCVVGDDDQSIYSWRGAEPKNLLGFDRDFPSAKVVKLERNYRSTGVILDAANAVISHNVFRHKKALWTERTGGDKIAVEECPDERGEAETIVGALMAIRRGENRGEGDFAILYRTHAQSRVLEEVLRARRIPYRVVGGASFFQRREIKDITEYLRLLTNPAADSAFSRIVNVPTRGIGDTTVERLSTYARERGVPLLEATRATVAGAESGIGPAAVRKLDDFVQLIDDLRILVDSGGPIATLVAQIIERSGYRARLQIEGTPEAADRARNLNELVAAAAAYDAEAGEGGTLSGFNERIALTGSADEKDGRGEAVTLMTIHAAKGLEFSVVFLAGMEDGTFPALRDGDLSDELEEERRLAYVAITRARDRLMLSWARLRRSYDQIRRNEPSRFLAYLPPELLSTRGRASAGPPAMASRPQRSQDNDENHDDHIHSPVPSDERVYYIQDEGEDDPVFPRGAEVRHRIFGVGVIEDGSGRGPDRKLTVNFPGVGRKTLVARYVERVYKR